MATRQITTTGWIAIGLLFLMAAATTVGAGQAAGQAQTSAVPVLSEVDRLRLVGLSQEVEIHRLRLQIAARALTDAREALAKPGYRLTDALVYEPIPVP